MFEPLFNEEDAVISDELNHASIIDGVRLCKAERLRYKNNDMEDLEAQLIATQKTVHALLLPMACLAWMERLHNSIRLWN